MPFVGYHYAFFFISYNSLEVEERCTVETTYNRVPARFLSNKSNPVVAAVRRGQLAPFYSYWGITSASRRVCQVDFPGRVQKFWSRCGRQIFLLAPRWPTRVPRLVIKMEVLAVPCWLTKNSQVLGELRLGSRSLVFLRWTHSWSKNQRSKWVSFTSALEKEKWDQ